MSTYHHWADPEAGLTEIRRVLAAGGRVLIVERMLKRSRGHGITPVGAERLADALQERGFASSEVDSMTLGRTEYLVISATT